MQLTTDLMIRGTLKLIKLKSSSDERIRVLVTNNGDINLLPLPYLQIVNKMVKAGIVKDGDEVTLELT